MIPGMNPRQMQKAMKQMGMEQTDIPALEVVVKFEEKQWVFKNPSLASISMMGQDSLQLTGDFDVEPLDTGKIQITQDDINIVTEQTNCTTQAAQEAIEKSNGDIAEAILSLSQ
jgi:nascent polypeptide-associated complex subunit alpha